MSNIHRSVILVLSSALTEQNLLKLIFLNKPGNTFLVNPFGPFLNLQFSFVIKLGNSKEKWPELAGNVGGDEICPVWNFGGLAIS